MIFDHISNLGMYAKQDAKLNVILEFLKQHPAETLAEGRHDMDMGIYANVSTVTVRENGDFEAHRRYADLQLVVGGSEIIEWMGLKDLNETTQYNEESDIQFFSGDAPAAIPLKLYPGNFAIFYPQDGHKPCLRLDHDTSFKVVFKIPMEE